MNKEEEKFDRNLNTPFPNSEWRTTMNNLQKCIDYCEQQNGRSSCKNCGLSQVMVDGYISRAELLEWVRKIKHYDKECIEKVEGKTEPNCWYNQALSDLKEFIEKN